MLHKKERVFKDDYSGFGNNRASPHIPLSLWGGDSEICLGKIHRGSPVVKTLGSLWGGGYRKLSQEISPGVTTGKNVGVLLGRGSKKYVLDFFGGDTD